MGIMVSVLLSGQGIADSIKSGPYHHNAVWALPEYSVWRGWQKRNDEMGGGVGLRLYWASSWSDFANIQCCHEFSFMETGVALVILIFFIFLQCCHEFSFMETIVPNGCPITNGSVLQCCHEFSFMETIMQVAYLVQRLKAFNVAMNFHSWKPLDFKHPTGVRLIAFNVAMNFHSWKLPCGMHHQQPQ